VSDRAGTNRFRFATAPPAVVLGKSSRQLLAFAVQRVWVAATRTLLGAAVADMPCAEAMSEVRLVRMWSATLGGCLCTWVLYALCFMHLLCSGTPCRAPAASTVCAAL
jgi:hypothetical protein